jgi:hypothetical protein
VDKSFLKPGTYAEELFILILRAKTHNPFNTRAVVPAAVKKDNLSSTRQLGSITLEVPLSFFFFSRNSQSCNPADTMIQRLGKAFDRASFPGSISSLKEDYNLLSL